MLFEQIQVEQIQVEQKLISTKLTFDQLMDLIYEQYDLNKLQYIMYDVIKSHYSDNNIVLLSNTELLKIKEIISDDTILKNIDRHINCIKYIHNTLWISKNEYYSYDIDKNQLFLTTMKPDKRFEIKRNLFVSLFFWNPFVWMAYAYTPTIDTTIEVKDKEVHEQICGKIIDKMLKEKSKIYCDIHGEILNIIKTEIRSVLIKKNPNSEAKYFPVSGSIMSGIGGCGFSF